MRNSNSKNEVRKEKRKQEIHDKIRHYLDMAAKYMQKAQAYQHQLGTEIPDLDRYLDYGKTFINQITRRVFEDEKIPKRRKYTQFLSPIQNGYAKVKLGFVRSWASKCAL